MSHSDIFCKLFGDPYSHIKSLSSLDPLCLFGKKSIIIFAFSGQETSLNILNNIK